MKITLIVILSGDLVRSTEHVGMSYLASCLRNYNHRVQILEIRDQNIQKYDTYISKLIDQNFVCITTTSVTMKCMNMKYVVNLAHILKEHIPNLKIACDGYMATFHGKEILENYPDIDFTIQGESEFSICELIESLESEKDLSDILGITYRDRNEIIQNNSRPLIENLDILPFPSRDQFEQHNGKFQYVRLQSSRGCLGNCAFCSSSACKSQQGPRWRGRSPKLVVDEIEMLVKKYNFHTYDFLDWTFEDPGPKGKIRIGEIAQEIIDRNLHIFYNCCFRAENWSDKDNRLLQLLVNSGLEKVNIGFESGNDRGLKILNKRATMEDNWRVIKLLRNFPDIYITFGFIMLHPYSTLHDLHDNANFLYGTGIGQVIRHYFWMLEVYQGTLIEKHLRRDNLLDSHYDIHDGMYRYHFQDPQVEIFVPVFQEMLKLKSVWDFEIFDILVHTFITRMRRKYKDDKIISRINNFSDEIDGIRKNIARFNYDFFTNILKNVNEINITKEKNRLNDFIKDNMKLISNKEYSLGIDLKRHGYELIGSR